MLGPSSERSVAKSAQSVRSGVYTAEMSQEEAVIAAVQRLADLSPIAFLRLKKKRKYCSALEQIQNVSLFFFPPSSWNVTQLSLLDWKSWAFPFLLATVRDHQNMQLLIPTSLGWAMHGHPGSRSSAVPVQCGLDPKNPFSAVSDDLRVKLNPGFCQDSPCLWIHCHLTHASRILSTHEAISPSPK